MSDTSSSSSTTGHVRNPRSRPVPVEAIFDLFDTGVTATVHVIVTAPGPFSLTQLDQMVDERIELHWPATPPADSTPP